MNRRSIFTSASLALVLVLSGVTGAKAQSDADKNYPTKPIHIIVGFSAGGGNDVLARLVGLKMSETFGTPILVENKTGAGGNIAAEYVARAPADGHTLIMAPLATMAINPAVYAKLPYSPRDFAPISMVAAFSYILAVNKDLPVRSVSDLVAYAKANPNKAHASGAAVGFQLATELLKLHTGAPIEFVNYKGSNDSVRAVISGEVMMTFVDAGPVSAALKSDQVRGLAVTAPKRLAAFPDIPTVAESGLPDVTSMSWAGLFAPAGTPAAAIKKIQDEVIRIVKLPEIRDKMNALAVEPVGNTSEEFGRIMAADLARWDKVAKAANIKLEP
jgi:tripartite-type tricarboxylate transporter receptor subunit TctC